MIAIGSLLVLVATSLAVIHVATLVLVATGLSRTVARFQAPSALSGAGFTTSESEQVVGHPLRRRVIIMLGLDPANCAGCHDTMTTHGIAPRLFAPDGSSTAIERPCDAG